MIMEIADLKGQGGAHGQHGERKPFSNVVPLEPGQAGGLDQCCCGAYDQPEGEQIRCPSG